ncbi:hypothetical protein [Paenibacillus sp. Soil787]|uniref:hypothetical protein n=1 Tax=Paenibacillus sp. Soil787 TaxID=1736411 RepID=UPI00070353D8|nr:hypothetical protein [Paenibacillus sp. Soil787]KRF13680.1 hypothetical protein ASG93_14325 [Paenibacillus sp. Soil787]
MKIFPSVADASILEQFQSPLGKTLMNHAFNTCGIEQHLAVASVLCPEIIEVKGYILISEFYNGNIDRIENQFDFDRKKIEQFINSWSLGDFFLLSRDESVENEILFEQFGKVLQHFWRMRFNELFPNREIIVELGYGVMGENGLTITVYQK